ncbi:hypothetical protein AOC36_07445 [Erysipelothrix larvae]|uniref:Peptidase S51 dipeptidase E n=1 Tax=Erysipelothrix larvae TaxID=1514105 RepID=A0A109UH71_9FIRM|nr:Type 1 glutamine amidotransferase-like domain-containing protein [Erysipelothrix larvae]AMC93823.1 hypothetical protein AOC36_07445 [Erysipelothrix larvae]
MHQNNKVIIGISAGSFVLQQNIDLVNVYTPQMNTVAMDHFEGMGLVDVEILPHFSKYCNRFENFEQRCVDYERYKNIHVMRINDGEGVLIRDNNIGIRI